VCRHPGTRANPAGATCLWCHFGHSASKSGGHGPLWGGPGRPTLAGMGGGLMLWALVAAAPVVVAALLVRDRRAVACGRALAGPLRRLVPRRAAQAWPTRRPIEDVAASVRRLGWRHHHPPEGQRHAKAEGIRLAYDAALGQACALLDVDHLLGVLPPGTELDAERRRVEWALECAGLELGRASH
jgi:hypothetical protein